MTTVRWRVSTNEQAITNLPASARRSQGRLLLHSILVATDKTCLTTYMFVLKEASKGISSRWPGTQKVTFAPVAGVVID
jgi:hypothetical protein